MDFFKLEVLGAILSYNLAKMESYDSRSNGFILYTTDINELDALTLHTQLRKLTISVNNTLQIVRGIKIKEIDKSKGKIVIVHNIILP